MIRRVYRRRNIKYKNNPIIYDEPLKKEEGINLLDTGLLIGIITVLGYFIAYAYQKGYWQYYGVTQEFMKQISIVNILFSMSVIGFGVGNFILYYQGIKGSLSPTKNPVRGVLQSVVLPRTFIVLGVLILIPKDIFEFKPIYLLYIFLGVLLMSYTFPMITEWGMKGYKNKLNKYLQKQEDEGFTLENIILKYQVFPSAKFVYLFVIFVVCYGISYLLGYNNAINKENYLIFDAKGKKYLVIDSNEDKFLITPVNLNKKEISKSFQIIDIKSDMDKPILFNTVKLEGGLKVKNEPKY